MVKSSEVIGSTFMVVFTQGEATISFHSIPCRGISLVSFAHPVATHAGQSMPGLQVPPRIALSSNVSKSLPAEQF